MIQEIMVRLVLPAAFALLVGLILIVALNQARRQRSKPRKVRGSHLQKRTSPDESLKKAMGVMDRILVILGVFLLAFIGVMIYLFIRFQSIPDTLVGCVFALCGMEGGVMGWIKTNKENIRAKMERPREGPPEAQEGENGND